MTSHPRKRTATGELRALSDEQGDEKGDDPAGSSPRSAGRSRALPADRGRAEERPWTEDRHPRGQGSGPSDSHEVPVKVCKPCPCMHALIQGNRFQPRVKVLKRCTMEQRWSVTRARGWHPVGSRICADKQGHLRGHAARRGCQAPADNTGGPGASQGHQGGGAL